MPEEADLAMTAQAMAVDTPTARTEGDDALYVNFFLHPKKNAAKSLEAGRPIFEDAIYIQIMVPGDKENIVRRPIMDSDRSRFAKQWLQFQATKEDQQLQGTPLSEWSGVTRSQVEELKFFNVFTVEQLAELPDSHAQKFMGVNSLKQKAKAYIEDASFSGPYEQALAENADLRNQMEVMQGQIAELMNKSGDTEESADGEVQNS